MTPQQIDLVRSSFARLTPIAEAAARLFYGRLFEVAPQVRPLFQTDMEEQGRKLMATLAAVVRGLDRLDEVAPVARELAIRHVRYGVRSEHYPIVGECLVWTLEQGLGPDFNAEVREAWTSAYGALSGAMIAAAYPACANA